jgi:paraquat-inducible protein B
MTEQQPNNSANTEENNNSGGTSIDNPAELSETVSLSKIWLLPLLALLIGLWMAFEQWREQGPLITINFKSAAGLEAGKTTLKVRDVDIGEIETISLQKENDGVVVSARVRNDVAYLLTEDSQFWIVSPRISHQGIYGLNTLFSGAYIELVPGTSSVKAASFDGLEDPPATPAGTPGLHITLNSDDQFAYSVGDPVIYKGLTVGQFEDVYFNLEEQVVYYNVFIKSPYHELISSNTRFWNIGGVRLDLTADGIHMETGNFQSLLTESVSFGLPDGQQRGEVISERSYFDIYPDRQSAASPKYHYAVEYVLLVGSSVRGLQVGAPVEYRGLPIGEVKAINYPKPKHYNLISDDYKIPVLIAIEPGRIGMPDTRAATKLVLEQNAQWMQQGLRASLQSANLLTGQLFVELQHYPDAAEFNADNFMGYPVMPLTLDGFSLISQQAGQFMQTLNELPLQQTVANLDSLMLELRAVADGVGKDLITLLNDVNQQALVRQLNTMLASMSTLANDYSAGSPGYAEIVGTLATLDKRLQELQTLLLQLNQQPNSLIFGGQREQDRQPKAGPQGER